MQKHLGTIPPSFFLTAIAASAWDRPRRGHLRQTTIRKLGRSAQAVPTTPFGGWRQPILPYTANENWIHKPMPCPTPLQRIKDLYHLEEHKSKSWKTPLQRSEDFLNLEDKFQGATIPEADPDTLLRDHISKSEDYKLAPWHTPSRWGEELSIWRTKFKEP